MFIVMLWPLLAQAETLPSLGAVETPNWGSDKTLADDKFPEYLEKQEDYTSAILEWRRVIYTSKNKNVHKRAYLSIADLYNKLQKHALALKAYEKYLSLFPKTSQKDDVLAQIHRLSLITGDNNKADTARKQLIKLTEDENFQKAAEKLQQVELYGLWHLALNAKDDFFETQSLKGNQLKENLQNFPTENHPWVQTSTLLSLIPGMGYLYLGYTNWAILILMLNASFFYALINAMKHKHWGYGFAFGSFAAFVYIGSMFYTGTLAEEKAYFARVKAMQTWQHLMPQEVDDFNHFQAPIQPHSLSPNSSALKNG